MPESPYGTADYMLTGQLLIIEKPIISLHAMEYYLIMKGQKR